MGVNVEASNCAENLRAAEFALDDQHLASGISSGGTLKMFGAWRQDSSAVPSKEEGRHARACRPSWLSRLVWKNYFVSRSRLRRRTAPNTPAIATIAAVLGS